MIYTVFYRGAADPSCMPQDFETYQEAVEYGTEQFGTDNFEIEGTEGEQI